MFGLCFETYLETPEYSPGLEPPLVYQLQDAFLNPDFQVAELLRAIFYLLEQFGDPEVV